MDKKKDAATAEFQNNQRDIAKTRVAGLIQSGVFTDTNGDIDTESVNSMVDQLVEDPTEKAAMMKFAKGVVSTVEIDKSAQKKRLVAAADTSLNESIKSITEGQTLDQAIKEIQALPDKFDPFKADMTKSATAFFSSFRSAMKPAPTVSKVESSISMEGALTDVRKGRIDRTQYINTYNANAEGLSETDRIKYGTSFQKEYDAMVDDSVSDNRGVLYNSVVTNTDENMLSLRDKVDRNELRDYIFNAQQMRHQTEKLLVEQADLEIANFLSTDRAKNISREQLLKELSIINATYESKDWITEYQKRKGESGEFQKLEKSISDEFNKRASAKSKKSMDWYSELPASQQRSIISIVSGGGTIDDAIRAAGRGEI
jgi:hypothetical protein